MPTDEDIKVAKRLKFTPKILKSKEARKATDEGWIKGLEI